MNVLLIAPESGLLATVDEVRAVSRALRPVILNGTVSRRDVLTAIQGNDWDIIWFAAHGDTVGIELSDGHVTVSDLTAVIRASGAWLVVLNTCSSRLVGLELHYELGVSVITTVADVDDKTAYQTGALLAEALAECGETVRAFETSRPGQNANYLLFHDGNRSEATEARTILMLNEWGARLSSKIDVLEKRVDREIQSLRRDVNNLSCHMQTIVRLPPWHRTAFVSAFLLLFFPVPLFYTQVRDLLGIGWQAALLFASLSYAASSVVWSYMWWGGSR